MSFFCHHNTVTYVIVGFCLGMFLHIIPVSLPVFPLCHHSVTVIKAKSVETRARVYHHGSSSLGLHSTTFRNHECLYKFPDSPSNS